MKRVVLLIMCVLFYGCASIVSGTHQDIKVDSEPKGATVTIGWEKTVNDQTIMAGQAIAGVTPLSVAISRRDGMIQISKDGYITQTVKLERDINYWFFGNVVLTSPLSSMIDTTTGAITEYRPGEYMITLDPVKK